MRRDRSHVRRSPVVPDPPDEQLPLGCRWALAEADAAPGVHTPRARWPVQDRSALGSKRAVLLAQQSDSGQTNHPKTQGETPGVVSTKAAPRRRDWPYRPVPIEYEKIVLSLVGRAVQSHPMGARA